MDKLVKMEKFIEKYKKGDIIYPSAVARYLGISTNDAIDLLREQCAKEQCAKNNIRHLYMIGCPACHNIADSTRYYDLKDIDMEWETGCRSCDCAFLPDIRDVMFLYEKL